MCTAICLTVSDNYFGRNLDYEFDFGEEIIITPRNYLFNFTNGKSVASHSALIGMALKYNDYPLYFDASNEYGLSMAGLNFAGNAFYNKKAEGKDNVASFELIPWVLTQCKTVSDAKKLLDRINITDEAVSENMPPSSLHWIIGDKKESITLEQTASGIRVFDNPVGVLTNNPTFDIQLFNLNNYMHITNEEPKNLFSDKADLKIYSRGMGAIGLPGDASSASRFVRACFTKLNSVFGETEEEIINQCFHILYSVYQHKGEVKLGDKYEITNYTSCCNTDKGIYYYTTYNNSRINAVFMYNENLESESLISYKIKSEPEFFYQN